MKGDEFTEVKFIHELGRVPLKKLPLSRAAQFNSTWSNAKKSRLIESFILNIPVPAIITHCPSCGSHEIIDGNQRWQTVIGFLENHFTLSDLEVLTSLNGCSYSNLPARIRDRLNNCHLKRITIIYNSDTSFEEINTFIQLIKERYKCK
jgi:uncharacterized protein with ParB-like and HNH nuclease domain